MSRSIFIENLEDGRRMDAASHWGSKEEAYDFRTPEFAIEFCIMRRLRNVRIIVDMGDPANNISLIVYGGEQAALQEGTLQNKELPKVQTGFRANLKKRRPMKPKDIGDG
jgi:hypothetical protein